VLLGDTIPIQEDESGHVPAKREATEGAAGAVVHCVEAADGA
jgi:hypothetical protein